MTNSRASRPSTSSRVKPVARAHASLKKRMRPEGARTQTSDIVVSVKTLANSSPGTNSVVSDIDVEERDLVGLQRLARHPNGLGREIAQLVTNLGARFQRLLVGPEREHESLRALAGGQSEQSADARAVTEPGQQLVADDLKPAFVRL